jgi:hypothetical protein
MKANLEAKLTVVYNDAPSRTFTKVPVYFEPELRSILESMAVKITNEAKEFFPEGLDAEGLIELIFTNAYIRWEDIPAGGNKLSRN